MLVFGHVGITVAGVRAVDREADLRAPILLSILPDLLDKPLALLVPYVVNGNTRSLGHTLLAALAVLAVVLAGGRRFGKPWLLWSCYAGHFLLDRMWLSPGPTIFLWPFLGAFPSRLHGGPRTPHLFLYDAAGEAIGLAILLSLASRHRLLERPRWDAFARTGRLSSCADSTIQY